MTGAMVDIIWAKLPVGVLSAIVFFAILLCGTDANARVRTVSWDPVTTYTDNTTIEVGNLPVTYDIWYVDSVTLTRTDVCVKCLTTSTTFSDGSMISGRLYVFYGQAFLQNTIASDNSPGYDWFTYFIPSFRGGNMGSRR